MATLPYWNNDEVISSDKLNSMVQAIINGDPLAVKVSNATKNDVNQIVNYLSSLYNNSKTNLNSATSTSDFDTAYANMTALVSNKLGAYANDDTVDLYSTGIRASIITFLQAYDSMMSNDRLNNKNTDTTLGRRIYSEINDRENADNAINAKILGMQANGGGRNLLQGTRDFSGDWLNLGTIFTKTGDTYNGLSVIETNADRNGVGKYYQVKQGETYTFSLFARYTSGTGSSGIYVMLSNNPENGFTQAWVDNMQGGYSLDTSWKKCRITFTATTDGYIKPRMERGVSNTNTLQVCGYMLEKGIVAHDWQPAPEDTDSYIVAVDDRVDANTASISKITSNGGGINILKDTDKMTNTNYWELRAGQSIRAIYGNNNYANVAGVALSDYNVQFNTHTSFIDYIPQIIFEQGTEYTVSFWATIVSTPLLYLNSDDGYNHQHYGSPQTISLQASGREYNGWKQVTATFKPTVATAYLTFGISTDLNNTVSQHWASSFKLEKGIIAHDWSPSPYDTQSQIDNLNANKISSSDVNWNLVAKNSSNTYNYASGSTINLPNNSSITVKDDRVIPSIYLPTYLTDYLPNTDLNNLATFGEYDNLFVSSATMATLSNRPTNPDTGSALTGDCFFTNHYAYSGTTVHAFQKLYSCDYNYVFIRSYKGGSSASWTNWSCLTPYA